MYDLEKEHNQQNGVIQKLFHVVKQFQVKTYKQFIALLLGVCTFASSIPLTVDASQAETGLTENENLFLTEIGTNTEEATESIWTAARK